MCKHVTLPHNTQVRVKSVTNISGLTHTEPKNSMWTRRHLRSANEIQEMVVYMPLEISCSNFFTVEKTLPKEMDISYATSCRGTHFAKTSIVAAEVCEPLSLTVVKATAASTRQPRAKVAAMSLQL